MTSKKRGTLNHVHSEVGVQDAPNYEGDIFPMSDFKAYGTKSDVYHKVAITYPGFTTGITVDALGWIDNLELFDYKDGVKDRNGKPLPAAAKVANEEMPETIVKMRDIVRKYLNGGQINWADELKEIFIVAENYANMIMVGKPGNSRYCLKYLVLGRRRSEELDKLAANTTLKEDERKLAKQAIDDHDILPHSIEIYINSDHHVVFTKDFTKPDIFTNTHLRRKLEGLYCVHQMIFNSNSYFAVNSWADAIEAAPAIFGAITTASKTEDWLQVFSRLISFAKKEAYLTKDMNNNDLAEIMTGKAIQAITAYAVNNAQYEGSVTAAKMGRNFLVVKVPYIMTYTDIGLQNWTSWVNKWIGRQGYPIAAGRMSGPVPFVFLDEPWDAVYASGDSLDSFETRGPDLTLPYRKTMKSQPEFWDSNSGGFYPSGGYEVTRKGRKKVNDFTKNQLLFVEKIDTMIRAFITHEYRMSPSIDIEIDFTKEWNKFLEELAFDTKTIELGLKSKYKGQAFDWDGNYCKYSLKAPKIKITEIKERVNALLLAGELAEAILYIQDSKDYVSPVDKTVLEAWIEKIKAAMMFKINGTEESEESEEEESEEGEEESEETVSIGSPVVMMYVEKDIAYPLLEQLYPGITGSIDKGTTKLFTNFEDLMSAYKIKELKKIGSVVVIAGHTDEDMNFHMESLLEKKITVHLTTKEETGDWVTTSD